MTVDISLVIQNIQSCIRGRKTFCGVAHLSENDIYKITRKLNRINSILTFTEIDKEQLLNKKKSFKIIFALARKSLNNCRRSIDSHDCTVNTDIFRHLDELHGYMAEILGTLMEREDVLEMLQHEEASAADGTVAENSANNNNIADDDEWGLPASDSGEAITPDDLDADEWS